MQVEVGTALPLRKFSKSALVAREPAAAGNWSLFALSPPRTVLRVSKKAQLMHGRIRTRLLAAGGSLLATGGLTAAMVAGTPALAADVQANAEVDSAITLTANDVAFTLTELPGELATSSSGLTAETNNTAGYNVTVQADAATLNPSDPVANTDTIPVSALQVENSAAAFVAASDTTPVTVHTQAVRSAEGGDAITADYQMTMPFVNADTYSGGLTFTATAN